MNKKTGRCLFSLVLTLLFFGMTGTGNALEHNEAQADTTKTPEISLSTDKLEFDFSPNKKMMMKNLVVSNIGTGNLTVSVSGLDGSGFMNVGLNNFTVLPGRGHNLRIFIPSSSLESTSQISNGLQAAASGAQASAKMVLTSNDPNNPVKEVEVLASLVPEVSAVLKIEGTYHFSSCDDETTDLDENGEIQLNFKYLPLQGHYNIVCDGDTCKGVTNAFGLYSCENGCTIEMKQQNIQWTIFGSLSKDKKLLDLDIRLASAPVGKYTVTCPNNPVHSNPWTLYNNPTTSITLDFKEGAEKIVSMGAVGEKKYSLINVNLAD